MFTALFSHARESSTSTMVNNKLKINNAPLFLKFQMSSRVESSILQNNKTSISANSTNESKVPISIWIFRIILSIILLLIIMPIALLLTPWWIWMQPFENKCPDIMNGYYRIVTWPLTISKKIRSYQQKDRFIERLKY